jgi:hypothetical protein
MGGEGSRKQQQGQQQQQPQLLWGAASTAHTNTITAPKPDCRAAVFSPALPGLPSCLIPHRHTCSLQ